MKLEAEIEWLKPNEYCNINIGNREKVRVDSDDVDYFYDDIVEYVEFKLNDKYGINVSHSTSDLDNGNFRIKNIDEIIKELRDNILN